MFDHFVYEVVAEMRREHDSLPAERQNVEVLRREVEDFGFSIGRKVVDFVDMDD